VSGGREPSDRGAQPARAAADNPVSAVRRDKAADGSGNEVIGGRGGGRRAEDMTILAHS